jgi:hypothetical protein
MKTPPRIVGGVHLEHPRGEPSYAFLAVDRGLKSGAITDVRLDEDTRIALIEGAAIALRVLRRQAA